MVYVKLTREDRKEIAKRFSAGDTMVHLAGVYNVCTATIKRVTRDLNAVRSVPAKATGQDLRNFAKQARSILWSQDTGKDENRKAYNSWVARVSVLESDDGGGLTHNEAVVRASKEYPCLNRLFREFDVREYDPNPQSHPQIQHFGEKAKHDVECEGIVQTFRESLRWAIDAAGEASRTGEDPTICPSNAAWYLYEQAISEPKDFLAKIGQAEAKIDADAEERQASRASGSRSIAELDGMITELELGGENDVT